MNQTTSLSNSLSNLEDSEGISMILPAISQQIQLTNSRFPQFLKILFFVEMWERFSYYGMRALLVLFLTSHLGFEDTKAYATYSLFAAIGYAGPVLGGYLADKLMGFRNMVLLGGIVMIIGHALMTLVEFQPTILYLGLALIAVGTGMFKGNVTNLLGSCYSAGDPERSRGFTLFYVGVNLGSFSAAVSCGYIAHLYGWHYGFGLAGIGMFIGLISFIKFQHLIGTNGLSPRPDLMSKRIVGLNIFTIVLISYCLLALLVSLVLKNSELFGNVLAIVGGFILCVFIYIIFTLEHIQRKNLIALSILLIFFMFFFALEMQLGSLINLFTKRNVTDEIFGITMPATISQAINPLSIIIIGSMLSFFIKFDKKYTIAIFAFGLFTMALCFFVFYLGCLNASEEGKVSFIYLLVGISLMGVGELCVGPLINEQATLLAPKHLQGFIMGIVLLAVAFSNLAGIIISKFMAVPSINGNIDILKSLAIYQEGFLNIGLFNIALVGIFLLFYIFLYKIVVTQQILPESKV